MPQINLSALKIKKNVTSEGEKELIYVNLEIN
jgi:hypothetical protein